MIEFPFLPSADEPYPVTIVLSRYGGVYEPGQWLAFNLESNALPEGWDGDDGECQDFWMSYHDAGAGDTPDLAYADLVKIQSKESQTPPA